MNKLATSFKFGVFAFLYSLFSFQAAYGDDTEVFFSNTTTTAAGKPNVLFIIDTSASMNKSETITETDEVITGTDVDGNPIITTVTSTATLSRLSIMQDVLAEFMTSPPNVNIGIARYSVPGGPILYPVTDPNEPAQPIVLQSVSTANDDATQSGVSVTLDSQYLEPVVAGNVGIIGLRFSNVGIPQGATITEASVLFSSDIASIGLDAGYEIYAQLVPNASEFSLANKDLVTRIPTGSATNPAPFVSWLADEWAAPNVGELTTTDQTPDLSIILQPVVNQMGATLDDTAGWCGGNDLVILLKRTGVDSRPILSYDKDPSFAPKLHVVFNPTIPVGNFGCYKNTIKKTIATSDADSEDGNGGSTSTDLDFFKDSAFGDHNTSVALSFVDLGIPKGAMILDANLSFVSKSTSTGAASTTISAVNSAIDLAVHTATPLAGSVAWSIPTWDFGVTYSSPSIASIVKSLVDLGANNMSFLLKGGAGTRSAYSFDGSQSRAPRLDITYKGKYDPSAATRRYEMQAAVEDFKGLGGNPLGDVYAEAIAYYKGINVHYGLVRGEPAKKDYRISSIESVKNGTIRTPAGCTTSNLSAVACTQRAFKAQPEPTYRTPIKNSCQSNHIVLLASGSSTSFDTRTTGLFETWTTTSTGTNKTCTDGDNCAIEMARYFHNNDVLTTTNEKEFITTHAIGFFANANDTTLSDVATAGKGLYTSANSKEDLIKALEEMTDSILDANTTFVSAGVTVNQYNRLTHNDELYFSLFTPSPKTVWPGNIKRYRLFDGGLVDVNGASAVDSNNKFAEAAKSWWSTDVDGNDVELGGAAEQQTNTRLVYSNITSNLNLTDVGNAVKSTNSLITEAMVSAIDAADRDKILKWATGENVNDLLAPTAARKRMGDPLHSQPTLLTYRTGVDTFKTAVYAGANDGFLRSIDTLTGKENWSFIPTDLLTRLSEIQKNTVGSHTYGLDGSVTLYVEDIDAEGNFVGVVDPGEKAYLYIGMRRGGSSYYALDVSNPSAPRLQFKIDPSTVGYAGLGQTWSKPVIKKMNIPNHEAVMIFGGGYSLLQDKAGTVSEPDTKGNNVYIADALTGELLWDAKGDVGTGGAIGLVDGSLTADALSTMNGVPNEITAFDFDGDEYIDHFYATDTKAQVFRFDINYDTAEITGGRIAHLQDAATAASNRRFYNAADASLIRLNDDASFVSIGIGSGYRAHPLDETVTDHFYMIKDQGIFDSIFDMDVGLADLQDVTSLTDSNSDGISDAVDLLNDPANGKKGWYISFSQSGEKVLSKSITFNSAILFTTYAPPSVDTPICNASAGFSRIYGMKVTDGSPFVNLDNADSSLTASDRFMELEIAGIAPQPQILLESTSAGVKKRLCVGNVCGLEQMLPDPPEGVMGMRWRKNK